MHVEQRADGWVVVDGNGAVRYGPFATESLAQTALRLSGGGVGSPPVVGGGSAPPAAAPTAQPSPSAASDQAAGADTSTDPNFVSAPGFVPSPGATPPAASAGTNGATAGSSGGGGSSKAPAAPKLRYIETPTYTGWATETGRKDANGKTLYAPAEAPPAPEGFIADPKKPTRGRVWDPVARAYHIVEWDASDQAWQGTGKYDALPGTQPSAIGASVASKDRDRIDAQGNRMPSQGAGVAAPAAGLNAVQTGFGQTSEFPVNADELPNLPQSVAGEGYSPEVAIEGIPVSDVTGQPGVQVSSVAGGEGANTVVQFAGSPNGPVQGIGQHVGSILQAYGWSVPSDPIKAVQAHIALMDTINKLEERGLSPEEIKLAIGRQPKEARVALDRAEELGAPQESLDQMAIKINQAISTASETTDPSELAALEEISGMDTLEGLEGPYSLDQGGIFYVDDPTVFTAGPDEIVSASGVGVSSPTAMALGGGDLGGAGYPFGDVGYPGFDVNVDDQGNVIPNEEPPLHPGPTGGAHGNDLPSNPLADQQAFLDALKELAQAEIDAAAARRAEEEAFLARQREASRFDYRYDLAGIPRPVGEMRPTYVQVPLGPDGEPLDGLNVPPGIILDYSAARAALLGQNLNSAALMQATQGPVTTAGSSNWGTGWYGGPQMGSMAAPSGGVMQADPRMGGARPPYSPVFSTNALAAWGMLAGAA